MHPEHLVAIGYAGRGHLYQSLCMTNVRCSTQTRYPLFFDPETGLVSQRYDMLTHCKNEDLPPPCCANLDSSLFDACLSVRWWWRAKIRSSCDIMHSRLEQKPDEERELDRHALLAVILA